MNSLRIRPGAGSSDTMKVSPVTSDTCCIWDENLASKSRPSHSREEGLCDKKTIEPFCPSNPSTEFMELASIFSLQNSCLVNFVCLKADLGREFQSRHLSFRKNDRYSFSVLFHTVHPLDCSPLSISALLFSCKHIHTYIIGILRCWTSTEKSTVNQTIKKQTQANE